MMDRNSLRKGISGLLGIIIVLTVLSVNPASAIQASSKVVFIGGYDTSWTWAGLLPRGPPDFSPAFTFATLMPGSVTPANLAQYDTAVLNMASYASKCNANSYTASEKSAMNDFVANGGKLIISDPECNPGVDYSWLTYPFNTKNPGATGSFGGTLTIFEENELSTSNSADAKYINTAAITSQTDAVGDMNVADTTNIDPNWCLDMTGTNVYKNYGATHMYAKSGSGLFIYNGLDTNYISTSIGPSGSGQLAKIWLQELQASGSNLPCGVSVAGISLTPSTATNPVGTSHTVTALVTIAGTGTPVPGVVVTFEVVSGPNAGATGTATTDAQGKATFTYSDTGGAGTDTIQASFVNQQGKTITSSPATKIWRTGTNIPEFPTVALPIISALGIVLLFSRKKNN